MHIHNSAGVQQGKDVKQNDLDSVQLNTYLGVNHLSSQSLFRHVKLK